MRYSVGIDLGTSNSCISICDLDGGYPATINIAQVLGPSVIGEKPLLPSALYLSIENEFAPGSLALPWNPDDAAVIGAFARERGALAPDRLVSSAKSWLCNPQVDRHAPILPWKSELEEGKLSPFEASRRYLEHLRQALEQALVARAETASLGDCMIVLTVPASFDEVARELTHQAAREAGLGNVTLLEEPQAAFYAWIAGSEARQTAEHWSSEVRAGDLVLVCDVGGGTADFTLIAVAAAEAGLSQALELHRIAVGEHILLGGDNMDLALAYALKDQISAEGHEIDHWQFLSLIHAARAAKERLLSDAAIAEIPIAVPTRGASLFAKTLSTTLSRAKAMALIIDGYFPRTAVTELPKARKSVGLQEFGLDYATEPAFSKHLARFLTRARENVRSDPALSQLLGDWAQSGDAPILRPSAVLFNGGVFHAEVLRERVLEVLGSWLEPGRLAERDQGGGPRHGGRLGRRLLRGRAAHRTGHQDPGRYVAFVLHRSGESHARGARLYATREGDLYCPAGERRRDRMGSYRRRVRFGYRGAGRIPVLQLGGARRRPDRDEGRECGQDLGRDLEPHRRATAGRGRSAAGGAGNAETDRDRSRDPGALDVSPPLRS